MKKIIGLIVLVVILQACKVTFSFTGADTGNAETFSVQYFEIRTPLAPANLGQFFTDELKDKITSQTSLDIVNGVGELNFEGDFTSYSVRPIAIQGDETAAQNRLTISVKVRFVNEDKPEFNFDKSFSHYADFSSDTDIGSVEQSLIEEIVEKLLEDIFNEALVNW